MSFFCDNCGKPVGQNDDTCTSCGAEFKGIRCPACSYSGPSFKFTNGCPKCGYLKKDMDVARTVKTVAEEDKAFTVNPPKLFYRISIAVLSLLLIVFLVILFKP